MKKINTKIIKIDSLNIDMTKLKEAGQAIREGKIVAFPTETVYGLGADALNEEAIKKIFLAKDRPLYDPLIVHINCLEDAIDLVEELPPIARTLGQNFWPGPLTMVIKKSKKISDIVTSGLDTVAIRVPGHPVAQALIREAQKPIVAPSANLFTHVSPTNAQHVIDDLKGKVDIIIDSGESTVGVESTVVDVTELPLKILRLGGTTVESIRKITAKIIIANDNEGVNKSPGMLKKHYAPKAKLILAEGKNETMINHILNLASNYQKFGKKVGIISSKENINKYNGFIVKSLGNAKDLQTCAQNLYAQLRLLDELECNIIISENFENKGLGRAIMDRLRRASN
ncbi:MAG TPA: L-threonylcarbamoyladenylate synthase [Atribacterota bacterium]|nr:L-threonylcarbamoyladenylate synthase [Atribacterota bacterium]